jgi:integrase
MEKRLAPATVRTNYGVLKAVFNAAVEDKIILCSPCPKIRLPPDGRRERQLLSPEQLGDLADALPVEYRPMTYLAGVLGLRALPE